MLRSGEFREGYDTAEISYISSLRFNLDCQRDGSGDLEDLAAGRYKRLASKPVEARHRVSCVANPAVLNGEFEPPVRAVKEPALYG